MKKFGLNLFLIALILTSCSTKNTISSITVHSHKYDIIEIDASCKREGITGIYCSCGYFSFQRIPKAHYCEYVSAKEPTIDDDGWIEHYVCKSCGGVFLNDKNDVTTEPLKESEYVLRYQYSQKEETSDGYFVYDYLLTKILEIRFYDLTNVLKWKIELQYENDTVLLAKKYVYNDDDIKEYDVTYLYR